MARDTEVGCREVAQVRKWGRDSGNTSRSGRGPSLRRGASRNEMILPPRVIDDLDSFSQILGAGRVGLFSDFDGTLTPLFDDPRNTFLSPAIRDTLSELSKKVELVAVVSGREVRFLREMIGLKSGRPEENNRNTWCRSRMASWKKLRRELRVLGSRGFPWKTKF